MQQAIAGLYGISKQLTNILKLFKITYKSQIQKDNKYIKVDYHNALIHKWS